MSVGTQISDIGGMKRSWFVGLIWHEFDIREDECSRCTRYYNRTPRNRGGKNPCWGEIFRIVILTK